MKLFGFALVCFLFLIPIIIYKKVYFRSVTALYSAPGKQPEVVSVKPTTSWFRSVASGKGSGLVHLGSGYYCFYVDGDLDKLPELSYQECTFDYAIYIFSRNRLGRFKSIDLSNRSLIDVLKKINSLV